jgi:hypothetical protein
MPGTPVQYDLLPGLDLSGLAGSITKGQITQAIAQVKPLSNVGGILLFSSLSGTVWPGTTNNPRFKRYLWLDSNTTPPTLRKYDQGGGDAFANWPAQTVSAATITPTELAAHKEALDRMFNSSGIDVLQALKLLRVDAAGQFIEIVSLATILSAGSVPLTALNSSGAFANYILARNAGNAAAWVVFDPALHIIDGTIALNKLVYGGGGQLGYIVRASPSTGILELAANDGTVLADDSVTLIKLDTAGALGLQIPQRNAANSATVWTTPLFSKEYDQTKAESGYALDTPYSFMHGLTAVPKQYKITLKCTSTDNSYAVNDEIDINDLVNSTGANVWRAYHTSMDSAEIVVVFSSIFTASIDARTLVKGTYGSLGALKLSATTKWQLRCRAWA